MQFVFFIAVSPLIASLNREFSNETTVRVVWMPPSGRCSYFYQVRAAQNCLSNTSMESALIYNFSTPSPDGTRVMRFSIPFRTIRWVILLRIWKISDMIVYYLLYLLLALISGLQPYTNYSVWVRSIVNTTSSNYLSFSNYTWSCFHTNESGVYLLLLSSKSSVQ